ncbi:MAG: hypothetical protein HY243_09655 [Proteobacteria bacterium]|nr:hypothetical protein [Pseudomonadota bacterium]
MKPEVDQILRFSAGQLITGIAPDLPVGYNQGAVSLLGFMMLLAAQEYDRAADIRVTENADIRKLFGALLPRVRDAALTEKLKTASESKDASLTISALDAANYDLRRLLIALHTHVETQGDTASAKRIWAVLKAMADRRVVAPPMG